MPVVDGAEFYTVCDYMRPQDTGRALGVSIWHGTPILRPYTSIPNYDLYQVRIVMGGVTHFFKNDHSTYTNKDLRKCLTKWLRLEREKSMEGLLQE